jgi:carbamoyl-phosphate synthase large subunit
MGTMASHGSSLKDQGYQGGLHPATGYYAVKVPVFSFSKLEQVDIQLGPEMKSPGRFGMTDSLQIALYKGMLAAG